MLDLEKTIAKELFEKFEYPWQVLPHIKDYIYKIVPMFSVNEDFVEVSKDIYTHKSAVICKTAKIVGPTIIDENAEIRQGAFIRGSAVIGKNTVVGNSTEIKNSILFDEAKAPHFNYVGDSIMGYNSHIGAGVVLSNVRADKKEIFVRTDNGDKLATGLKKFGAILGNYAEIGCNSVLCPGSIIENNCIVYPLSMFRGTLKANCLYKNNGEIILINI